MTDGERRQGYLQMMRRNPEDPRHGTRKGYTYGCRCERCAKANEDYCEANVAKLRTAQNKSLAKALLEMDGNPSDPRHGTHRGYKAGCRCERCREAGRDINRRKGRWKYSFPAHRSAHRDMSPAEVDAQARKVVDEALELLGAVTDCEGDERVMEECLDTLHACETLLRSWGNREVSDARDRVVEKNRARGYYEEMGR